MLPPRKAFPRDAAGGSAEPYPQLTPATRRGKVETQRAFHHHRLASVWPRVWLNVAAGVQQHSTPVQLQTRALALLGAGLEMKVGVMLSRGGCDGSESKQERSRGDEW